MPVQGRGGGSFREAGLKGRPLHILALLKLAALALLVPVCVSSCGIDTVILLYPPQDFSVPSKGFLDLSHQVENYDPLEGTSQSFKGYEIYYRAFDDADEASDEAALMVSKADEYSERPLAFWSYATDDRSFARMRLNNSGDIPLMKLDSTAAASEKSFYISMKSDSNWKLSDDGSLDLEVFRSIAEPSRLSFYKRTNFLTGDADYAGENNPSNLYFVFIAFAYGVDASTTGQAVYSIPFVIAEGVDFSPGL